MTRIDHDKAADKLRLWFFRDLSDEQRINLFRLFAIPADELVNLHGAQNIALRHVLSALVASRLGIASEVGE